MSKELIKRLRSNFPTTQAQWEAADRIEELEREVERLNRIKSRTRQVELQAENDALQADSARLRKALKKMNRAYVGLMENARDRIIMLGGDCDPVDVMEYSDQNLCESRAALSATPAQSLARLRNQAIEKCAVELDGHWDMAAGIIRAMKEPE